MNIALCQFKFPFETGVPIFKKPQLFSYKDKYDKYYVADIREGVTRGEVAYYAIANRFLEASKQTRPMSAQHYTVNYVHSEEEEIPEVFGTFLGRFIPIYAGIGVLNLKTANASELRDLGKQLQGQFFEPFTEIWWEMLPGPHKVFQSNLKPVWVSIPRADLMKFWSNIHDDLVLKGMTPTELFKIPM